MKKNIEQLSQLEKTIARFKRFALIHEQGVLGGVPYTRSQLDILTLIVDNINQTTKNLAEELYVSSGAITQTVETLFRRGLVSRERDEQDKRISRLRATSAGHRIVDEYKTNRRLQLERWLKELNDNEATILITALDRLADIGIPRSSSQQSHAINGNK